MEKVSADFYDEDYFENGITSSKSGYNGYHWNDSISMNAKDLIREFNPKAPWTWWDNRTLLFKRGK